MAGFRNATELAALVAAPALLAASAVAAPTAYDPSSPGPDPKLKAEAKDLAQKVWSGALRTCGAHALESVDGRVVIELDEPRFTLAAMRLPEAARESGYAFRAVALASAKRWRWAPQSSGPLRWSEWRLGATTVVRDDNLTLDRGNTTVEDVVLKFDIVKKDGQWSANFPISSLNYAIKPVNFDAIALPAITPACGRAGAAAA